MCRNLDMCETVKLYTTRENDDIDPSSITEVIIVNPVLRNQ